MLEAVNLITIEDPQSSKYGLALKISMGTEQVLASLTIVDDASQFAVSVENDPSAC